MPSPKHLDPAIQRVRLDALRIFEISEAELEALERGSTESLFLNLALAVLSVAISFSITLASTKIDALRVFCVFVIITVLGYVSGIAFLLLWLIYRKSLKSVSQQIRARIPPIGVQES